MFKYSCEIVRKHFMGGNTPKEEALYHLIGFTVVMSIIGGVKGVCTLLNIPF